MAGRTSSFHYKGKNEDLRTIGQTLGVANVLEGSVRKQGNRVRITAQLVQASDGFHRWSKSYDGELTDVFELQERIARDLTGELQVVLQGEQQARLVPVATRNPEAYALYLQATAIFNRRDGDRFHDAIAQVEQAIRLDPGYARAHSRLATLQALLPAYVTGEAEAAQAAAEAHARRASALDPALAEPHAVLGLVLSQRRRHLEALAALRQALALEPDDVTANFWYAATLTETGYLRRGTEVLDRVLSIDPILPNALMWRGQNALIDGDLELAERLMRRAQDLGLTYVGLGLSAVADARGQRAEAGAPAGRRPGPAHHRPPARHRRPAGTRRLRRRRRARRDAGAGRGLPRHPAQGRGGRGTLCPAAAGPHQPGPGGHPGRPHRERGDGLQHHLGPIRTRHPGLTGVPRVRPPGRSRRSLGPRRGARPLPPRGPAPLRL